MIAKGSLYAPSGAMQYEVVGCKLFFFHALFFVPLTDTCFVSIYILCNVKSKPVLFRSCLDFFFHYCGLGSFTEEEATF